MGQIVLLLVQRDEFITLYLFIVLFFSVLNTVQSMEQCLTCLPDDLQTYALLLRQQVVSWQLVWVFVHIIVFCTKDSSGPRYPTEGWNIGSLLLPLQDHTWWNDHLFSLLTPNPERLAPSVSLIHHEWWSPRSVCHSVFAPSSWSNLQLLKCGIRKEAFKYRIKDYLTSVCTCFIPKCWFDLCALIFCLFMWNFWATALDRTTL